MTAATVNKINAALAKHGVEVVKGKGYFYFADLPEAPTYHAQHVASVFSTTLRCMSLEEWIAHAEDAIRAGTE